METTIEAMFPEHNQLHTKASDHDKYELDTEDCVNSMADRQPQTYNYIPLMLVDRGIINAACNNRRTCTYMNTLSFSTTYAGIVKGNP